MQKQEKKSFSNSIRTLLIRNRENAFYGLSNRSNNQHSPNNYPAWCYWAAYRLIVTTESPKETRAFVISHPDKAKQEFDEIAKAYFEGVN